MRELNKKLVGQGDMSRARDLARVREEGWNIVRGEAVSTQEAVEDSEDLSERYRRRGGGSVVVHGERETGEGLRLRLECPERRRQRQSHLGNRLKTRRDGQSRLERRLGDGCFWSVEVETIEPFYKTM